MCQSQQAVCQKLRGLRAAPTGVLSPSNSPRSLAADVSERQNTNSLKLGSTRAVRFRVYRTTPRTYHSIQETHIALPAPPPRQTPKVALTTPTRGRRGAPQQLSGALPTRPTKAEARPGGCGAETKKKRAGKCRNHRLTAQVSFLARQLTPHPTPTPTYAPSASCADDATWSYGTKASNTCAYVARKLKRCKAKNTDGVRTALEACPVTCDTC